MSEHRVFICAAIDVEQAREELAAHQGGEGMLTTGLSPDGLPPATHYISSGMVELPIIAASRQTGVIDIYLEDPYVVMDALGLKLMQAPAPSKVRKARVKK